MLGENLVLPDVLTEIMGFGMINGLAGLFTLCTFLAVYLSIRYKIKLL